ncbi:hypothetical protein M514_04824 [Trichuris suis]|uniref:Uncharacterized protein n=1 Tax=Trichuris suis TaxID=68888 RepID=A0A085MAN6_9BILA|nr:hypothetical protein M513_04824 [Trichuris suis]KFD73164.1 hypothetical protein M514_04824 [Trichuris suis]
MIVVCPRCNEVFYSIERWPPLREELFQLAIRGAILCFCEPPTAYHPTGAMLEAFKSAEESDAYGEVRIPVLLSGNRHIVQCPQALIADAHYKHSFGRASVLLNIEEVISISVRCIEQQNVLLFIHSDNFFNEAFVRH